MSKHQTKSQRRASKARHAAREYGIENLKHTRIDVLHASRGVES